MFTLKDGRDCFYQWDSNVQIAISDPTVNEVHFCNRTDECSLVVDVYEEDGKRLANVPNILLQNDWSIRVYAFCTNYTKVEKLFKVKTRSKPADYIYEETDVLSAREILVRSENTLDKAEQALEGADNILTEARESVDSSKIFANAASVSATAAQIHSNTAATSESNAAKSATDALSNANKAKQHETNAQAAALDAVSAKEEVDEKIAAVENSLDKYYTKEEIENKRYLSSIPSEYITESELNSKGYLTQHQDLSKYALKTEIPTNYLTSIPSEYITETELNAKNYLTEHQDLSEYAKTDDVLRSFTFKCTSKSNITAEELDIAIEVFNYINTNKKAPDKYKLSIYRENKVLDIVDLSVENITSSGEGKLILYTSPINPIDGALTGYIYTLSIMFRKTDLSCTYVEAVKMSTYLTKAKYESNIQLYATKKYVDDAVANIPGGGGGGSADLSNYYTKDETYSKTEIDNKGYLTSLPEHTHDQYLTEHQSLDNYYTKSETYSKTEVDNAIANIPTGGGGSSEGGAKVVAFSKNWSSGSPNDDDKKELEDLYTDMYNNDCKLPEDRIYYTEIDNYQTNNRVYVVIESIQCYNGTLIFKFTHPNGTKYTVNTYFDSSDKYNWCSVSGESSGSKDWQRGSYGSDYAEVGYDNRHAKVIGYFSDENNIVTFDVSVSTYFGDTSRYIHMPTVYIGGSEYNISFYNDYGTLRVRDSDHNDYYDFTITGCYYWG